MVFKLFITSLVLLTSLNSWAEIIITDINRFSRAEGPLFGNANITLNTIYGGTSGVSGASNCTSTTSTCNTCTSTSAECNSRAIHDELELQILIQSTTTRGKVRVVVDDDQDDELIEYSNTSSVNENDIQEAGSSFTINIPWENICNEITQTTGGCEGLTSGFSESILIGIDGSNSGNGNNDLADSEDDVVEIAIVVSQIGTPTVTLCQLNDDRSNDSGLCNFIAYPGDKKVFIENVRTGCDFPDLTNDANVDIQAIRVLYAKGSDTGNQFPENNAKSADLIVSKTGTCQNGTQTIELTNNEIKDLDDGETYYFRLAAVDEANNIGLFLEKPSDSATITSDLTLPANSDGCFDPNQHPQNCHIATPSEVAGLLDDDLDCFITTATYGSPYKPQVKTFRKFRDQYLRSSFLGTIAIETYYLLSPPLAQWIDRHPKAKPFFRVLLWPYWFIAKALTSITYILISIFFALSILFIYRGATKREAL